jgi:hypothetical protein
VKDVAHLKEATFALRMRDGDLEGDLRLRVVTPEGSELWDLGWGNFGPVDAYAGKGMSCFEFQARSWFDDHVFDLAMRNLVPDRGFDEVPLRFDVPDDLRRLLDQ